MRKEDYQFKQETIDALAKLGEVLKGIYARMRSEGYDIIDGEIRNVETGELWVDPRRKKKL